MSPSDSIHPDAKALGDAFFALSGFYYGIVEGEPVHAGDTIGYCGHTGTNMGNHVHWRVGTVNAAGGDPDCPEESTGIDLVNPVPLHAACP